VAPTLNMSKIHTSTHLFALACIGFTLSAQALDVTTPNLAVKVVAEVQIRTLEQGRTVTKLVPADKVVPGDLVLYTLEITNVGPRAIDMPLVIEPIPTHMVYVENSASGPGSEISFSTDSGHSFERPENLTLPAPTGHARRAAASEYTHIRWQMKSLFKASSVAFVRFRARVK
jgi:uncharacterized repeat protein (TIGR01451 family)